MMFLEDELTGLGFTLVDQCSSKRCGETTKINSCAVVGSKRNEYEMNSGSALATLVLCQGQIGSKKFCRVMDLLPPLIPISFLTAQKKVEDVAEGGASACMPCAANS